MYYTVILTDTSGQEIAQRAISGDSGVYQMEVCARGMLDKYGRSIVDTLVSVARWDGKCYEIVEKNLLKGVAQEECVG
jgi:F420-0:gamma-glutamyl ligase